MVRYDIVFESCANILVRIVRIDPQVRFGHSDQMPGWDSTRWRSGRGRSAGSREVGGMDLRRFFGRSFQDVGQPFPDGVTDLVDLGECQRAFNAEGDVGAETNLGSKGLGWAWFAPGPDDQQGGPVLGFGVVRGGHD